MIKLEKEQGYKVAQFYEGWNETLIWSYTQGYMGEGWINAEEEIQSSIIVIGDFCFLGGRVNESMLEHLKQIYKGRILIVVPPNKLWREVIQATYQREAKEIERYATLKEAKSFDCKQLTKNIEKLKGNFSLQQIDEIIYEQLLQEEWSRDLCSQFENAQDYIRRGKGYVILEENRIVSGASSYTIYEKGIEIEIDTHPQYRRQGLARICASQLILVCIKEGIYPSWDAANKESLALAQQLGYTFDAMYRAYEVTMG